MSHHRVSYPAGLRENAKARSHGLYTLDWVSSDGARWTSQGGFVDEAEEQLFYRLMNAFTQKPEWLDGLLSPDPAPDLSKTPPGKPTDVQSVTEEDDG